MTANSDSRGMCYDYLLIPLIGFFLVEIKVAGPCLGATTGFMVASGGVLSDGYGHGALAPGLAMAKRRPIEYRRKLDASTRCSGVCPHT